MEDIVITSDQSFLTIETAEQREIPTIDYAISQIINLVIWTYHFVPIFNDNCVHLIRVIPGSHLGTICPQELADVGMAKMEI
jgi:hypothetical protein